MKMVRIFMMWIMLLALPVQGMAQVSMFACHLNGGASSESVQMMDHSMHGEVHSHDHSGSSDTAKKVMKSLHGCCNCAPSCAVIVLPVSQVSFGAIQHDKLHPALVSQAPHSADTRRIDRPPKTLAI